ncbi:MAG: Glu/Leu/Phe/Val dehydrogenase [Gemmatimonadetes bacterium]|nr:Glu/Leu/Phe/Val dehydrogenase [Gemmatimonadota bacterium]
MTRFDFDHVDDLGPEKTIYIHDPRSGLRAVLVVDNVAAGPSMGGIRMAPDVTTDEVFRLARAMTLKNAGAGLPHGGGKAGILADPHTADKEPLIRSFARAIRDLGDYIPGPDMGTDETCMAWIRDEIGRSVGLPRVVGGIPLDEIGATGHGLAACAEVAAEFCDLDLDGAALAIEGFGNVGRPSARLLVERGAVLVAASDSKGAIHAPEGIDVDALEEAKEKTGSVTGYARAESIAPESLFTLPCDILIPAARPDCIHEGNVDEVQARLVLQGANIPATEGAERRLHDRGILNVPDFIANAGGVICASVEFHGGNEDSALEEIRGKIRRNTRQVLEASRDQGVLPREAAVALARRRVEEAMSLRREFR